MRPANRRHDHDHHDAGGRHDPIPPLRLAATEATEEGRETRSSYGTIPGGELPVFVYVSVLAAFGWIMLASWVAFARDMDADLPLGIAVVLGVVFFALPVIIRHAAVAFSHPRRQRQGEFLAAPVETATGPLSGADAWLQVLIIPLALALAATLIGAAYVLVR
jgi:hypothetical protein